MKCKCGSELFYLEPRKPGQDVLTAPQVALKCLKCHSWIKWCSKSERKYYLQKTKCFKNFWNEYFKEQEMGKVELKFRAIIDVSLDVLKVHPLMADTFDARLQGYLEEIMDLIPEKIAVQYKVKVQKLEDEKLNNQQKNNY